MRLIDADKIDFKEVFVGNSDFAKDTRDAAQMLINQQPTVDAVPVVHAKWILVPGTEVIHGKSYECSNCSKIRYGSWPPMYCQRCGAKMDRKKNIRI